MIELLTKVAHPRILQNLTALQIKTMSSLFEALPEDKSVAPSDHA